MDFESYIGKERQLLNRIDRERAELNSHEPDAWRGNYQLAADEIKLLRAGDYVSSASEMAAKAIVSLDERMARLEQLEAEAGAKNEAFLKRVADWEAKFDGRYAEVMAGMAREMAALEARNAELKGRIEASEGRLQAIAGKAEKGMRETGDRTVANVQQISERAKGDLHEISQATTADVQRLVSSLKAAQAEFESSVNEKLAQDQQTLEKVKFMISTMSDIIKT